MFEKLQWHDDRVTLNGVTFLLEGKARQASRDEGLWLHKDRTLIDAYERLFADYPALHVVNMLELGIWKGGSAALWMEALKPMKSVAIDLMDKADAPYFTRWVGERDLGDRLKTYWSTDQADTARVLDIVRSEFDEPLDFVIDDASHAYAPTKVSFETLFPLVREDALYVIEDWAWKFAPEFQADFSAAEPGLAPMIGDLSVLVIGVPGMIRRLDVRGPFIVLQRGPLPEAEAREGIARIWRPEPGAQAAPDRLMPLRRVKRGLQKAVRGIR